MPKGTAFHRRRLSGGDDDDDDDDDDNKEEKDDDDDDNNRRGNKGKYSHHAAAAPGEARPRPGPMLSSLYKHAPLQRSYLIACASGFLGPATHPDPLVLSSLGSYTLDVDVQLYDADDAASIVKLVDMPEVQRTLRKATVSCGEVRGADAKMRKVGWEQVNIPRSDLDARPISPSRAGASRRASNGKCKGILRSLVTSLPKYRSLHSFTFTGINLSFHEVRLLSLALTNNVVIRNLTIRRVLLTDAGAASLLTAIATTSVSVVVLSHVGLTDASRTYVSHVVKNHCCRRDEQTWALSLRDAVGICPCAETAPGGIPSKGVLCMDLSDNRLSDATAVALSSALTHDGWMQAVNLSGNRIGMVGLSALIEMLVTNRFIRCVNLQRNLPIMKHNKGPKGIDMLAAIMATRNRAYVKASRQRPPEQALSAEVASLVERWSGQSDNSDAMIGIEVNGGEGLADVLLPDEEEGDDDDDEEMFPGDDFVLDERGEGGRQRTLVPPSVPGAGGLDESFSSVKGGYRVAPTSRHLGALSPSGLKFAEGFVDDEEEEEEEEQERMVPEAENKKKKKKTRRKKLKKKAKKVPKTGVAAITSVSAGSKSRRRPLSAAPRPPWSDVAPPPVSSSPRAGLPPPPPSRSGVASSSSRPRSAPAASTTRTTRVDARPSLVYLAAQKARVAVSRTVKRALHTGDDMKPPPYMKMTVPEFERALFGNKTNERASGRGRGSAAAAAAAAAARPHARVTAGDTTGVAKRTTLATKTASGKRKKAGRAVAWCDDVEGGTTAAAAAAAAAVTTTKAGGKSKGRGGSSSSDDEILVSRSSSDSKENRRRNGEDGKKTGFDDDDDDEFDELDEATVLVKLESMIHEMGEELGALESRKLSKALKEKGDGGAKTRRGKGVSAVDKESLIKEISAQVHSKLKSLWEREM